MSPMRTPEASSAFSCDCPACLLIAGHRAGPDSPLESTTVDAIDHQLIGLLRVDARLSTVELAKTLGVSRGTVVNRLARLEKERIIIGYTVCVKPDTATSAVVAWVSIAVEGDNTREVVRALLSEPALRSLHDTNGRWDLVAEVEAGSIDQLSQLLERIRIVKGIENTETSIHLRSFKSRD